MTTLRFPPVHYDLIIIGFGMATHRLLLELGRQSSASTRILVLGEEPEYAYNRVLLPQLIENSRTDVALPALTFGQHQVTIATGDPVVSIDRDHHQVYCQSGRNFVYQQLVFATGSSPVMPDFWEADGTMPRQIPERILALRNTADVARIRALPSGSHIVIQGGGFIALETAAALSAHYQVTICHRGPFLMNRQLDQTAALLLQTALEARGIKVLLRSEINGAKASPQKLQLALSCPEGVTTLAADLLIAALGVTPRCELAKHAGLACQRGILVNPQLQSSDPAIFAIGECAEYNNETIGLVAPVYQQATVLAQILSGQCHAQYQPQTNSTNLKISGLAISSVGDVGKLLQSSDLELTSLIYQDQQQGDYRRIWLKNGQLQGAVLCGDTSLIQHYQLRMQQPIHQSALTPNAVEPNDWLNTWLFDVA